jgi:hypothetical protein
LKINIKIPKFVIIRKNGAIAQLGERLNGIQEVRSSILLSSTADKQRKLKGLAYIASPF